MAAPEIMAQIERTIPASGNATNATLKLLTACLLSQAAIGPCIAKIAIGRKDRIKDRILEGKKIKPPQLRGFYFTCE